MNEPIRNPHDITFKQLFSDQAVAGDFIKHYLPREIIAQFDLNALEISKDSFVDAALQSQCFVQSH